MLSAIMDVTKEMNLNIRSTNCACALPMFSYIVTFIEKIEDTERSSLLNDQIRRRSDKRKIKEEFCIP